MTTPPNLPCHTRAHMKRISAMGVAARQGKVLPYSGDFLTFLDQVGKGGSSRAAWRTLWKCADGEPLTAAELIVFQRHTGRTTPPTAPAREVLVLAGRRGGKSEMAVTRACWRAISRDWSAVLSRGERGVIPIIASDRDQARNTLQYLKGLARDPLVRAFVAVDRNSDLRLLRDRIQFRTGVDIVVRTCDYRTLRGYTLIHAIAEEVSFWQSSEQSSNPDEEIVHAIRPALLTTRCYGSRIVMITTPYARRGVVYQAWERHWGRDDSDTLVWNAATSVMWTWGRSSRRSPMIPRSRPASTVTPRRG